MRLLLGAAVVATLAYGGCEWMSGRPVAHSPGVLVPATPEQREVATPPRLEKAGWRFTALAAYEIRARVLGKERYRWDEGASLVPVDLAVGWGPMSDSRVLAALDISQGNRWYYWRADRLPVPANEIAKSSANMHLIAADAGVAKDIARARPGQVVRMRGYLVEARRDDGFTWRSSLSREDSGAGACELMWVERFSVE